MNIPEETKAAGRAAGTDPAPHDITPGRATILAIGAT